MIHRPFLGDDDFLKSYSVFLIIGQGTEIIRTRYIYTRNIEIGANLLAAFPRYVSVVSHFWMTTPYLVGFS